MNDAVLAIQLCYPQVFHACQVGHPRARSNAHRLSDSDSSVLAHIGSGSSRAARDLARHMGCKGRESSRDARLRSASQLPVGVGIREDRAALEASSNRAAGASSGRRQPTATKALGAAPAAMGVGAPTMSAALGHVERQPRTSAQSTRFLALSAKGRHAMQATSVLDTERLARLLAEWSPREVERAVDGLRLPARAASTMPREEEMA